MASLSRPSWLSVSEEREIRRILSQGKLQAVKYLHDLRKNKGISSDVWGLKESKDYCDNLEILGEDPLRDLENHVESLERMEKKLQEMREEMPIFIRDAMPYLSEENVKKACEDINVLKSLLKTSLSGAKFGI